MEHKDDNVVRIEEKLIRTVGSWDRIPLLLALSNELCESDALHAYNRAHEALRLAQTLDDKFWIANAWHAIAVSLSNTGKYTEMLVCLEKASHLFCRINDRRRKAEIDAAIGTTLIAMGCPKKALSPLKDAFRFFSQRRNRFWMTHLYTVFGDARLATGEYCKSLRFYRKALRTNMKGEEEMGSAHIYVRLAALYERVGDTDRQKKCLGRSLALYRKSNDTVGMATAMTALIPVCIEKHAYARARQYIERARQIFHERGYTAQQAALWGYQGELYAQTGDLHSGLQALRKGIVLAKGTEDQLLLGRLYMGFGLLQTESGKDKEGINTLHRAFLLFNDIGDPYYLYQVHQALARGYELVGDTELALKHYKLYTKVKEQYVDGGKVLKAGRIEMRSRMKLLANRLRKEHYQKKKLRKSLEEKNMRLTSLTLQLVQTSERLRKKKGLKNGVGEQKQKDDGSLLIEENWKIFAQQFNPQHEEFYSSLINVCPELTPTELKVCSLVRSGLSSCQISDLLSISRRTVDRHRENVRAKLNVPSGQSLASALYAL